MIHYVKVEDIKLYPHEYTSKVMYLIGDWICFKKWVNGKMRSGCFSFEVKKVSKSGNEYKYWLE